MATEIFTFPESIASIPVSRLKLPARVHNALSRAGISDVSRLTQAYQDGLKSVKGVGTFAVETVRQALTALGGCIQPDESIDWRTYHAATGTEFLNDSDIQPASSPNVVIHLPDEVLALSIGYLHLPLRVFNALINGNITTIGALLSTPEQHIRNVSGIGSTALAIITHRLQGLSAAIGENGSISWFSFWKSQGIAVIPESYRSGTSIDTIAKQLSAVVKEILLQDDDDRDWRIIERRFGLTATKRLTLDEIGKAFDLTRERVRQIESKALEELRSVLLQGQYVGLNYHIHPELATAIKRLFDAVALQAYGLIPENELFAIAERVWETNVTKIEPLLVLMFSLAKMDRIEFTDPDITPVWEAVPTTRRDLIVRVVDRIDDLLTCEIALAIDEFDLLLHVNRELPKGQKITTIQLRRFVELCRTIEQREDGLYQGKFQYLKSRSNQAERMLTEAGKPLDTAEIVRGINSRTVPVGGRKLSKRNLSNQIRADSRFVPIGHSGKWALRAWDHIDTASIIDLMERCLIERNSPATASEIFGYIADRRPANQNSIAIYLTQRTDLFGRVDSTHWGLSSWTESRNSKIWSPEQVADFVATIFKQHRAKELELCIVRDALRDAAKVSDRQAQGMLNVNPVIQTRRESYNKICAVFQPDYNQKLAITGARIGRKKATIEEQLAEHLRAILVEAPGQEMPVSSLAERLMKLHGYKRATIYAYISRFEFVEKYTIPGSRTVIVRMKGQKSLNFPQVETITDNNARTEIRRAIKNLTLENVDIGLFLLGRQFEVVIKRALIKGSQEGVINLASGLGSEPSKWKLVQMVDCAKQCGLISDLGVANLLRQERNERTHGEPPSLDERQALMNGSQYLAGLYIDYILLFSRRTQEWT